MPDPVDLSVTRQQFGDADKKLWLKRPDTPRHLQNPPNGLELMVIEMVKDSKTAEEFLGKLYEINKPDVQRTVLLDTMRKDGAMIKARSKATSSDIRDLKAKFMVEWVDRMQQLCGVPNTWMRRWLKDLGAVNKKGKLAVEFGGDP